MQYSRITQLEFTDCSNYCSTGLGRKIDFVRFYFHRLESRDSKINDSIFDRIVPLALKAQVSVLIIGYASTARRALK